MKLINDTFSGLRHGNPCAFLNLTLFPLLSDRPGSPDYVTLRQAVADKTVVIREVSESGSVPELELKNSGKRPVLILDGEELIGAKQNRTANVTILAPARKSLRIPVACVESGRWAYTSREFNPSEQMHFSAGRKRKMASVSMSRRTHGTSVADQSEVWGDIARKCASMNVAAPTSAMSSVYETHRTRVDDYAAAFRAQPGQVGAVFAIGDKIEGLELFDNETTLAELLPKLVRSYAIDAIESLESHRRNPDPKSASAFTDSVAAGDCESYDAIGIGTDVRLTAPGVIAGGLVADGRVVHLAAFASDAEPQRREQATGLFSDFVSRLRDRRRRRETS